MILQHVWFLLTFSYNGMHLLGIRLFNHLVNTEGIVGAEEIYSHGWLPEQ